MYPLKFDPILKPTIWGGSEICKYKNIEPKLDGIGESWEISHVKTDISVVSNGEFKGKTLEYLINQNGADLLGKKVAERFGSRFPLLIKFIDACDDLSIQVHPNDKLAKQRHNSFGKTEMWYVISAKEGAKLYSGFSKSITPDEYIKSVEENTFTETLHQHTVQPGDVFFLPSGRIHSTGAGIFIAEIQQTSDITYRIYDYNRKDAQGNSRELHTELAKDAIDFNIYPDHKTIYEKKPNSPVKLATCKYFETNLLELDNIIQRNNIVKDSFIIYICMEGKAEIKDLNGESISIAKGETALIPATVANVTITPTENALILETYIP